MNRRQFFRALFCFLVSATVFLACNHQVSQIISVKTLSFGSVSEAASKQLIVSAAASLTDAMKAVQPLYQKQQSEIRLTYNFGSSGSLQQQIEQGAPVDVFISAAPRQMNELEKKGLLFPGTRKNLLTNQVVLIVPKGSTKIKSFNDLIQNQVRRIAVGDPESVPAGKYAQEVMTFLKIFDRVQPKLIYAKNVRQVLNYVETGNVDAGIVYRTDAKASPKVTAVVAAPKGSHSPIVYPIAVIKDSKNPDTAKGFVTFLSSSAATAIFEKLGFGLSS
ncbi:MAG: molybdate ABC transporter substrate-binding protein [Oscillatoriales cyanobacterium RM2_1_1]|nr:molybdate ABC transporter substrate-binding protein [Oscillatoriales cyanobacterium RM2_1_1]